MIQCEIWFLICVLVSVWHLVCDQVRNLQTGPISQSVTIDQAEKTCQRKHSSLFVSYEENEVLRTRSPILRLVADNLSLLLVKWKGCLFILIYFLSIFTCTLRYKTIIMNILICAAQCVINFVVKVLYRNRYLKSDWNCQIILSNQPDKLLI